MITGENKQVVRRYLEAWIDAMTTGDFSSYEALVPESMTLWISGDTYQGKQEIADKTRWTAAAFDMSSGTYLVENIVAEDDLVFVEMDIVMPPGPGNPPSHPKREDWVRSGPLHVRPVHVFRIHDGVIIEQREYLDRVPSSSAD